MPERPRGRLKALRPRLMRGAAPNQGVFFMAGQIVSEKATTRQVRSQNSLDPLFAPKSVAVIGATENANSVGRTVLWNLLKSPFGGTVYPVNPKRSAVLGI